MIIPMKKHYHIITCDSYEIMTKFINSGLVGVRPVLTKVKTNSPAQRQVAYTTRMNWDILADVARVKKGDYVMLHSGGIIKGIFEATHDPLITKVDANLFDGPKIDTKQWHKNWGNVTQKIATNNPVWWIPIRPVDELFFEKMSMDIIFDSIVKGKVSSLPNRLRYEDKNKTIKGLTDSDFEVILELFFNYSYKDNNRLTIPSNIANMIPITFEYLTCDGYEKNLESLIIYRIRSGMFNISGIQFSHLNVFNTVPLGYLKMADLLTWNEKYDKIINPWIWELKSNPLYWNDLKDEIKKLSNRAAYLNTFFKCNVSFKVSGVVVAQTFNSNAINKFKDLITPIGVIDELFLIKYVGTGKNVQFNLVARVT